MADKKGRPMVTVLCDREDFDRYHGLAKRLKMPLSVLVRHLLDAEELRLDELDARKARLARQRPPLPAADPAQVDIEEAIARKTNPQRALPTQGKASEKAAS